MLIEEYARRAESFDLSRSRAPQERRNIALYGLAGEIGSLIAAIKKQVLAAGRKRGSLSKREIVEELGDSLWYVFTFAAATGPGPEILNTNIVSLHEELEASDKYGELFRAMVGVRFVEFTVAASIFLKDWGSRSATLDAYQETAFLTRRTADDQLIEVCIIVLQQLLAELFRPSLPEVEKTLNRQIPDRPIEKLLGETAWHLAALASLYRLSLSEIAQLNLAKLEGRYGRGSPTPLHDASYPLGEQLPRLFDVSFVPVGHGRSRMYLDGRSRLGSDLTDNSHSDDGYRFHDAMHLAFAAKLGWSPVLRRLLGRKRRSNVRTDEVEDGARAAIVEEALIKVIHAEGVRRAALTPTGTHGPSRLFADSGDVSFGFLRNLGDLVAGLEVALNAQWEWEAAILEGFTLFHRLQIEGRGNVTVDLNGRSLTFQPDVLLRVNGSVAAFGQARIPLDARASNTLSEREKELVRDHGSAAVLARRGAMAAALGLDPSKAGDLDLRGWEGDVVACHPRGEALEAMWRRGIVVFRVVCDDDGHAQAIGIADA